MSKSKILVALIAGLFSISSAFAGEMTVTGSMQATYQSDREGGASGGVTGNPLGLNTDLAFTGTTEVLNGTTVTWTMATDGTFLSESGADHKLVFTNGFGSFQIGNSGDAADAVDDITPSAFEEANGSGSGLYGSGTGSDLGSGMDGSMSVGYRNADVLGTGISFGLNYYPKLDGSTVNEKGSSTGTTDATSAYTVSLATSLANVPVIGSTPIGGLKVTVGYENSDSVVANADPKEGATIALNYAMGPVSLGYQKKAHQPKATAIGTKAFYKDDIIGIAFAVNDSLALSWNRYSSTKHANIATTVEQETDAINLAYTVGGLTIAIQDASTDNYGYTRASKDDTRTLSLKTAF